MWNSNALSPELEESCQILDQFTRSRFHRLQESWDEAERRRKMDGKYDLVRLLRGLRENNLGKLAPYEKACSDRIAENCGRQPHPGYAFVPVNLGRRDLTAGVSSAGGYLVSTDVAPGDMFAGFLHASSALIQQKISRLAMVGNAGFPKISGAISTYWLPTEGTALTESQFQFTIAAATPKTVGAYCEISDLFLKETSPAARTFVLREMALATAAELGKKLLQGSGAAGELSGLLNVSGISSVTGTSLAYAGILDAMKNVENANGLVEQPRAGFVMAPDTARLLRSREKAAGSGMIMDAYTCAGLPAQVSKSCPDASLVFGDWSQLVLCEWGILEVGIDPYGGDSGKFRKAMVGLRSIWSIDAVVLHAESFCKITSIT
jgi:HK97 family phage major capsid protein